MEEKDMVIYTKEEIEERDYLKAESLLVSHLFDFIARCSKEAPLDWKTIREVKKLVKTSMKLLRAGRIN